METPEESKKSLTQAEIDSLLATFSKDQPSNAVKQVFSFKSYKPDLLSPDKLRRLRTKHESLVHSFNSTLSMFLRKDFTLRITRLDTITHNNLIDLLPGATHLTLFRLDPFPGMGVLEITTSLGLTVVTRMLGSTGHAVKAERDFTEIEFRLMAQFAEMILREYTAMWRAYEQQLNVVVMGYENSARFLKLGTGAPDSLIVFLSMEARFGDSTGFIRIAVPYLTLEPLIRKVITELLAATPAAEVPSPVISTLQIPAPMLEMPITVQARWEGLQLTVEELQSLRKDDVLVLDQTIPNRTTLYLGGVLKYLGQIGRKDDQLTIRISSEI